MENIMKILTSIEDPDVLGKDAIETIKNKTKEQKGGIFYMLLSTLDASLMENILAVRGVVANDTKKRWCNQSRQRRDEARQSQCS